MKTNDDLMLMHIGIIERVSNLYPTVKKYAEFESATEYATIIQEYDKAVEDMAEVMKEISARRNGRSITNVKFEKQWNKKILEVLRETRTRLSTTSTQKSSTPSTPTE